MASDKVGRITSVASRLPATGHPTVTSAASGQARKRCRTPVGVRAITPPVRRSQPNQRLISEYVAARITPAGPVIVEGDDAHSARAQGLDLVRLRDAVVVPVAPEQQVAPHRVIRVERAVAGLIELCGGGALSRLDQLQLSLHLRRIGCRNRRKALPVTFGPEYLRRSLSHHQRVHLGKAQEG